MAEEVKTSMQFINDVVTGKLTAAKKENDFIYHAKIPTLDSLPDIKGLHNLLFKCGSVGSRCSELYPAPSCFLFLGPP